MRKKAVVAVGGNAITRPGQKGTIPEQYENAERACQDLLALLKQGYDLVLTHGNGPQVGNILLRVELSAHEVYTLPLDTCVADCQGGMGYMLQQVMSNVLAANEMDQPVATVVTQVVVDEADPGFENPSKPVGPFYRRDRALDLERKGWRVVEDSGRGYRRVVASPIPTEIVEIKAIRALLDAGTVVIAAGGGGIPVIRKAGKLHGVEAVVDKDFASSLLARELNADLFLIATGIDRVYLNFGTPGQRPLDEMTSDEAESYIEEGQFAPGSMEPKIRAALEYLRCGGREVLIADIREVGAALRGESGTRISR